MQPEALFPVSLCLKGKACLVLGDGPVAEAKLAPLLDTGALVSVVSPHPSAAIGKLAREGRISLIARPLETADCRALFLAIDSGECPADTPLLRGCAKEQGFLLNSADQPDACDYFTPAVVRRGPVQVAISTGGAAPALARNIRQMLDRLLPRNLETIVSHAATLRDTVKQRLPAKAQRHFWDHIFSAGMLKKMGSAKTDGLQAIMKDELQQTANMPTGKGKVYLVGAGAGASDMISLKALRLLEAADIIFHDALLDPDLLDHARRDAEIVGVGKRCGKHSASQAFINRSLENAARQGKTVVRLKCGDPFIFGRGGEELMHLQAARVHTEVVPGITAASVAAADYGIPLTHRGLSRRVTLMTASTNKALMPDAPEWHSLLTGGTVVLYMAKRALAASLAAMLEAGVASTTPVAVISDAGRPTSETHRGTIASMITCPPELGDAPSVVMAGAAVGLANQEDACGDARLKRQA